MIRHPTDSNRYHSRKAAGLCPWCGKRPQQEHQLRCVECTDRLARGRLPRQPNLDGEITEGKRYRMVRGYNGGRDAPAVLEDIGAALGITRERARQIQAAALNRFCHRMMALGWSHDDALLGLAILGVQSMEREGGGREVVRGKWYTAGRG